MSNEQHTSGPEVNFAALILGFSSAALHYMGEAPLDSQGKGEKNLELAKQNIDIIQMLKSKTAGNLSTDEEALVSQVVTDLQLKFVEASK